LQQRVLNLFCFALLVGLAFFFQACGTTHPLPAYEPPLARTDFQTVKTTAYTHTESDHREYGNRNALGGTLHAASPPIRSASAIPRAIPVDENGEAEYQQVANTGRGPQPFSLSPTTRPRTPTTDWPRGHIVYGSAASDWSRWPAGTIFRLLSTGQIYQVDDYGWALSGRNTIDLYMATRGDMNAWGARTESIQILAWGDPQESLRLLSSHQDYRHIKRMVLELEGRHRAAAELE
jgi:3D (Asp-Asp-Asp) domain-containing protein